MSRITEMQARKHDALITSPQAFERAVNRFRAQGIRFAKGDGKIGDGVLGLVPEIRVIDGKEVSGFVPADNGDIWNQENMTRIMSTGKSNVTRDKLMMFYDVECAKLEAERAGHRIIEETNMETGQIKLSIDTAPGEVQMSL